MTPQVVDRGELLDAKEELCDLYEWLSQSPAGQAGDLHGLDVAITLVSSLLESL